MPGWWPPLKSGESWAFNLVLATRAALHCSGYEMFCFYTNLATFCKHDILVSLEEVLGAQATVCWDPMFWWFLSSAFFLEIYEHDFQSSAESHSLSLG